MQDPGGFGRAYRVCIKVDGEHPYAAIGLLRIDGQIGFGGDAEQAGGVASFLGSRRRWRENSDGHERPSRLVRLGFVNGLPGFVTLEADGELQTTALLVEGGRVAAIYVMRNPDKLGHLH